MQRRSAPRIPAIGWFPFVLAAFLAVPAWGANFDVAVGGVDTVFTPATLNIQAGDSVTWHNAGGFHNVQADDSSFTNGPPSGDSWTFVHKFDTAGTFGYHCVQHGAPGFGMFGTIHVAAVSPPPDPHPGAFRFSQANTSVSEAVGQATITVQRVNGSDGAVSVAFSAAAGTATAGQDFTPASGTLNWANGDSSSKTFKVTVLNDTIQESNETVLLALASPTGGATLDDSQKTATLTIIDNDGPPPSTPPAAPTSLTATAQSPSEIDLAWTDNASNETGFTVESRSPSGTYQEIGTVAANVTTFAAAGLDTARLYFFRVRATGSGSTFSAYSNEASEATDAVPGPCVAGPTTQCINNRFKIEIGWRTATDSGQGQTVPLASAPSSGLFYFFGADNIEMLIKVINACVPPFNHYWVFFAATTNVEFTTTVTDTQSGKVKVYFNPLNTSAPPVQDVNAFATCP
ncbi:MAG TPA: Calx-beta domain-containing protein [Thermoanaerobaculia bacterium]|nr:Calx-beta domain-containing protein [Thermoanaerobaculia bacterium]